MGTPRIIYMDEAELLDNLGPSDLLYLSARYRDWRHAVDEVDGVLVPRPVNPLGRVGEGRRHAQAMELIAAAFSHDMGVQEYAEELIRERLEAQAEERAAAAAARAAVAPFNMQRSLEERRLAEDQLSPAAVTARRKDQIRAAAERRKMLAKVPTAAFGLAGSPQAFWPGRDGPSQYHEPMAGGGFHTRAHHEADEGPVFDRGRDVYRGRVVPLDKLFR